MRFNHMELTLPRGTLTSQFREDVDRFCAAVFGWSAIDSDHIGQICHLLLPGPEQFILLTESDNPTSASACDHLGLLLDSRAEVDRRLVACERYAEHDDRVTIVRYDDLVYPGLTVHAFNVKYLLPLYFDVESMEHAVAA